MNFIRATELPAAANRASFNSTFFLDEKTRGLLKSRYFLNTHQKTTAATTVSACAKCPTNPPLQNSRNSSSPSSPPTSRGRKLCAPKSPLSISTPAWSATATGRRISLYKSLWVRVFFSFLFFLFLIFFLKLFFIFFEDSFPEIVFVLRLLINFSPRFAIAGAEGEGEEY